MDRATDSRRRDFRRNGLHESVPCSASVIAASDDCEVLEILRNVLYMLQRTNASKTKLDQLYRMRSLDTHLRKFPLFANLPAGIFSAVADFLKERVRLIRVHPGQMIFREDEQADHFYMVRIGFVKVSRHMPGGEEVVNYIGPEEFFGEIGLLARMPEIRKELNISDDARRPARRWITSIWFESTVRISNSCSVHFRAIDPFLPKCRNVSKRCFRGCSRRLTVRTARSTWRTRLRRSWCERLEHNRLTQARLESAPLEEFLQQGLMEASNLLVLDLEKCTALR